MPISKLWAFLHFFFSFSFVGGLVLAEWNGRAARVAQDWRQRAVLLEIVRLSTRVAGLGGLVLLGIFGNLLAVSLDYRMSEDRWLQGVNGLWIVGVLAMAFWNLPAIRRLSAIARDGGGEPGAWEKALARWRVANMFQSLFYLAMLVLMVIRAR